MTVFMEEFVRPFVQITSTPTIRVLSAPAEVLPDAHIRWGQTSEFNISNWRGFLPWSFSYAVKTEDDDDPPKDDGVTMSYGIQSQARKEHRIEHPDDPEMYVIVRTTTSISFQGPTKVDGFYRENREPPLPDVRHQLRSQSASFRFNIKPEYEPEEEEGSGQIPEEPPMDQMEYP